MSSHPPRITALFAKPGGGAHPGAQLRFGQRQARLGELQQRTGSIAIDLDRGHQRDFPVFEARQDACRGEDVTAESKIDPADLRRTLAEVEDLLRADNRYLPRYADLGYIPGHFTDIVQRELPCAESQLKLMVHSTGEVGGCWGHDPQLNVRAMSIRAIVDSPEYRAEHARLFRKECVGCGSNYSLNLRWRPSSYVADARWRLGLAHLGDR